MPFINGRFYANPAYGRVLERARQAGAESEATRLGHDDPGDVGSESELLSYRRSYQSQPVYEDLPYNSTEDPDEEPEFEEVAAQQSGQKRQPIAK